MRSVALNEPLLWDTVILPPLSIREGRHRLTNHNFRRFIENGGIDLWFSRTRPSQFLALGDDATEIYQGRLRWFLRHIHKYSRRLRFISLAITDSDELTLARKRFPRGEHDFGALEEVKVICAVPMFKWGFNDTPLRYKCSWINNAANLRTLTMNLENGTWNNWRLPSGRLTRISLWHSLDMEEWQAVFQGCPNLTHADIRRPRSRSHWRPGFQHEKLSHLKIGIVSDREAGQYRWESLTEPVRFTSLVDLDLEFAELAFDEPGFADIHRALGGLMRLRLSSKDNPWVVPLGVQVVLGSLLRTERDILPVLQELVLTCTPDLLDTIAAILQLRSPTTVQVEGKTIVRPGLRVHVETLVRDREGKRGFNIADHPMLSGELLRRFQIGRVIRR